MLINPEGEILFTFSYSPFFYDNIHIKEANQIFLPRECEDMAGGAGSGEAAVGFESVNETRELEWIHSLLLLQAHDGQS